MADTPTTPTVTPDAATTPTPDQSQQATPPAAPAGAAPPSQPPQPPTQTAPSGPAAAPPTTKPSGNVWKNVIEGALSGLAKTGKVLGRGVGTELNTWARNSPRGQELQQNAIARKGEIQRQQQAQQEEQRAQQEEARKEALFPGQEQEQKLMLNHLTNQNAADAVKNSLDRSNADEQIQENEMKKNQMQADLLKIFREQGYNLNEEHGAAFDNLGKQQAQDMVSGKVFALSNGLTGKDHGIVIGNVAEAQQTPLLKDANDVLDGWTLDPKTGALTPHTSSFAANGHNTIYDLLMAQYSAQNEWAIKSKQAEGIIQNRETAGGGGTTKALIKFEQDPSEMAGDKAQDAISAAQTALNDPSTTPDLKARWQKILNTATSTQKLTEDQKTREAQNLANIQAGLNGGGVITPQNQNLTGDAFVQTLPLGLQDSVRGIGRYQTDFSELPRGKEKTPIMQAVLHAYGPDGWSEAKYKERSDYLKEYGTSTKGDGATRNRINTALGHLDMLAQAGDALAQNNLPKLNEIANALGAATGQSPRAVYDAIGEKAAGEVAGAIKGGGASATDPSIAAAREAFKSNASPQTRNDVIKAQFGLLKTQVDTIAGKFQSTMGQTPNQFGQPVLYGNNQQILNKWTGGGTQAQQPVKIGGQTIPRNPDGTVTVSGHNYKIGSDGKTLTLVSAGASGSF